jgi:SAM-dependent methyltransferase
MDLIEAPGAGVGLEERRHPWELSRSQLILGLTRQWLANASVADVGAGDCFFAKQLLPHGIKDVTAVDIHFKDEHLEAFKGIRCLKSLDLIQNHSLDILFLMDVLEHVPDDVMFLNECVSKLKSGGRMVIMVPAFQFLFSQHDVRLQHYRRYSLHQLYQVIQKTELQVQESFYCYFSLLLIRLVSRLSNGPVEPCVGRETFDTNSTVQTDLSHWAFAAQSLVTRLLVGILRADFYVCRFVNFFGIKIPGLSGLTVCRKK